MIRIVSITFGYLFLALGVLGLFLPVLQGILFLAIGLLILAPHQLWAGRTLDRLAERFPAFKAVLDPARRKLHHMSARVKSFFGINP